MPAGNFRGFPHKVTEVGRVPTQGRAKHLEGHVAEEDEGAGPAGDGGGDGAADEARPLDVDAPLRDVQPEDAHLPGTERRTAEPLRCGDSARGSVCAVLRAGHGGSQANLSLSPDVSGAQFRM